MPFEVSMSGGGPWGFRLNGGGLSGQPIIISRVTPGGKAAQANVMQGDVLVAVNGVSVCKMDLSEIMENVKISGISLRMTLLSQDEIQQNLNKRKSEANITSVAEQERPKSQQLMLPPCRSTNQDMLSVEHSSEDDNSLQPRMRIVKSTNTCKSNVHQSSAVDQRSQPKFTIKLGSKQGRNRKSTRTNLSSVEPQDSLSNSSEPIISGRTVSVSPMSGLPKQHSSDIERNEDLSDVDVSAPEPKPRKNRLIKTEEKPSTMESKEGQNHVTENELQNKKLPDSIRRQLKVLKPLPQFQPGVQWLHNKLRLTKKPGNEITSPGNTLKLAAAAYPCQRIEIDGPLSATIVHAQYNTPVGMYSADQIVNTLVNTAAAKGTEVQDPFVFGDQNVPVDTNTPVYKSVHQLERASPIPAQSRSIQILNTLLDCQVENQTKRG